MKKHWLFFLFWISFFAWCWFVHQHIIDVNSITDLSTLQKTIATLADDINMWSIDIETASVFFVQLQQKYLDLTDISQQDIDQQFDTIQNTINTHSTTSYLLPLWAKKMNILLPQWMNFDRNRSKQYITNVWDNSLILVYHWTYDQAIRETERIAKYANLYISKTFEKGQSIAEHDNLQYISWLDIDVLQQSIVYVNHELFDANIENSISVSLDQDGTLIIEATQYK